MPNTPRGYPYPAPTGVAPDVPYDLERLASALDVDVEGLEDSLRADSGWHVPSGITYRSGWASQASYPVQVRKLRLGTHNLVLLRGALVYSSGSVTGVFLTALPVGYRPDADTFLGAGVSSGATVYELLVQTGGSVMIPSGYHSGPAPTGMVLPLHGAWTTTQ